MASLDEFFAKKDKNKRGKKNKLTPEELAKQLETKGSTVYHRKKDQEDSDRGSGLISNSKLFADQGDDEWKEFEDAREKDYRGLKIVSLNIKDKEEETLEKQKAQERINEKPNDESGPWNKRAASPAPGTEEPKPEVYKEETVKEEPKPEPLVVGIGGSEGGSGKARYVPPALRNAGPTSTSDNGNRPTTMAAVGRKGPKGSRPKIDDAQDFPSLSLG